MEDMVSAWQDKNVFVTGGMGFLGSHLVDHLNRLGANTTVLVRDLPNSISELNVQDTNTNLVFGNVKDFDLIKRILLEYEIDMVFHLAAQALVTIVQ